MTWQVVSLIIGALVAVLTFIWGIHRNKTSNGNPGYIKEIRDDVKSIWRALQDPETGVVPRLIRLEMKIKK